ncbi:MAG: hypothetical protein A4E20_17150 [Nitrospira sp. SG-bin2]|uniref:hypothetical protein n=1 Tax=Nitrospira cf. moscoviensis SBR1015 TaxID=96242 RepID=UPI000A0B82A4|nr:hypothetical protein [Nitrospira cf. moscoviensis SBR1015]OQW38221.1 MAG: hypothetical protein A4E20_17150 [Nitrospira sp. SG-bin2]
MSIIIKIFLAEFLIDQSPGWEGWKMKRCKICTELGAGDSANIWNKPLFESPNFVALPSLGSLVEGWLLLVSKTHLISYGAMPDAQIEEMNEFKDFLCSILKQCYGPVTAFEHGPSMASRSVGCGVDHAHLHLVPLAFDLEAEVSPFLPANSRWIEAGIKECQDAHGRGEDYLYLEQPIGIGRIVTHDALGSQLFRRAIAMRIGVRDQYNWREYEHLPTVMATILSLRDRTAIGASSLQPEFVA